MSHNIQHVTLKCAPDLNFGNQQLQSHIESCDDLSLECQNSNYSNRRQCKKMQAFYKQTVDTYIGIL